jgi:hypothetical protein
MNKLFLVFLLAAGLGTGCGTDDSTTSGSNPLTTTPAATSCGGDDACKGVACPNGGKCHVEAGNPVCVDACAAVRCANGPCVVKDGKPVCTDSSTGTGGSGGADCRSTGCASPSTCEPCRTTTGAAYICLRPGIAC